MTSTARAPSAAARRGLTSSSSRSGRLAATRRHGHDGTDHRVEVHPGTPPPATQERPATQPLHHGAGRRHGYGGQLDDDVVVELGAHSAGADDDHRPDPRHLPGAHQQLDDAVTAVLLLQQVCPLTQPGGHLREGGHGGGPVGEADPHTRLLGLVLQPRGLEHEGARQLLRGGGHVLGRAHLPARREQHARRLEESSGVRVPLDRRPRLRLRARHETGHERGQLHHVAQGPAGPVDAVERRDAAFAKERDARALRAHRVHQEGDPGASAAAASAWATSTS